MALYSLEQLQALVSAAGFPASAQATAVAVAMAESGGSSSIVSGTGDYGLWQINHRAHPNYDTGRLLSSPAYNAAAAYSISSGGADWSPWSAFKNGSYRKFLPQAQAVARKAGVTNTEGTPASSTGTSSLFGQIAGTIPGGSAISDLLNKVPTPGDVVGGVTGGVTGGWVDDLVHESYKAILALMLATAGVAIAGLGLARLTSTSGLATKIAPVAAAGATGGASLAATAAATSL